MPKNIMQAQAEIAKIKESLKTLVGLLLEKGEIVAKEVIERELEGARASRSPEAKRRRPGTGYDKLIKVAKDSVEKIPPDTLGIGKKDVLNSFTNPHGEPIWRFFEYGTYKKGASFGFWPVERGAPGGMYGEGISVPIGKGAEGHPPMPAIFFLQLAYLTARKEMASRIPAIIRQAVMGKVRADF